MTNTSSTRARVKVADPTLADAGVAITCGAPDLDPQESTTCTSAP